MRFFLLLLFLFPNFGCAPTDGRNEQIKYDNQEIERKLALYSSVQGVYEGHLEYINGTQVEAVLKIISQKISTGQKTSSGETKFDVVLKAIYEQSDRYNDIPLAVHYDEGRLELSFSNENAKDAEVISFTTQVVNGKIIRAKLHSDTGLVGHLNLIRTSQEVIAPGEGSANNRLERIRKKLKEVEGTYEMVISPNDRSSEPFSATLRIIVDPITGLSLSAIYQREGSGIGAVNLPASYSLESQSKEFKAKNSEYSILGRLENNTLTGIFQTLTFNATFVARKQLPYF